MAPPSRKHQEIAVELLTIINNYIKRKDGSCKPYVAPFAVFLNKCDTNYVEPDISVICDKNKLTDRGCTGVPDWIIEIVSSGNSSQDYIRKLNLYADAGIREYWIVNPVKQTILVYFFGENYFDIQQYTFQDKIKANIYEDFYIDFTEI